MAEENINLNAAMAADPADPAAPREPQRASAQQKKTLRESLGVRRRINSANLLLVGLFVAGTGCLYLLSLANGPEAASAGERSTEAKIDAVLMQIGKVKEDAGETTSAIVDTFYYEAAQRQIPLDQLAGNPFRYRPAHASQDAAANGNPAPGGEQARRDAAVEDAAAAVQKLVLQSVLTGADGAKAMISNNLLSEGQTINGWTVLSIRDREVTLTWKDKKYVLTLPR